MGAVLVMIRYYITLKQSRLFILEARMIFWPIFMAH